MTMTTGRGSAPPVAGDVVVQWTGEVTPCRRMPDVFDETRTALDRALARHLCLHHCPQLAMCEVDRATAAPEMLAAQVFAGRLASARGRERKIEDLPAYMCPAGCRTRP